MELPFNPQRFTQCINGSFFVGGEGGGCHFWDLGTRSLLGLQMWIRCRDRHGAPWDVFFCIRSWALGTRSKLLRYHFQEPLFLTLLYIQIMATKLSVPSQQAKILRNRVGAIQAGKNRSPTLGASLSCKVLAALLP